MDAFNQIQPNPVMSNGNSGNAPGENDVIVGANCNKHSGNLKFQQFIKAYKRARLSANAKIEATAAVKEVVQFWRSLSPRGRFLTQKKGSNDGQWHEVDDKQAMRIASFFLMNQRELKRQKSIDAMRTKRPSQTGPPLMRSQSGPAPRRQVRGSGCGPDLMVSGMNADEMALGEQMSGQSEGQIPDVMESLEPMPIGPTSSTSSMGWEKSQLQQKRMSFHQRKSFQEPVKPSSQDVDQSMEPFDFNPLPFKPNKPVDDFEPLQANFNNFGGSNVDVSANTQSEQVQLSVNMVVNTKGFQRDNAVNTVTNIQIGTGTISDERKQPSKPPHSGNGDCFPGQNFQLTTDTSNGFIQISAQSNAKGAGEHAMMSTGPSQRGQMNDIQVGFVGSRGGNAGKMHASQGNTSGTNANGIMGNNGMQTINGNMVGMMMGGGNMMSTNGNMMNGNGNMMNNNGNLMNGNGSMMMNNNGNTMNGHGNMMTGNGNNMVHNNGNLMNITSGKVMNPNQPQGMMMNNGMQQQQGMMQQQQGMMNQRQGMMNQPSMNSSNMMQGSAMGGPMINNTMSGQNFNMNMNNSAGNTGNSGGGRNNGLRWNKNEVANSVACAATLVESVFDDW